MRDKWKDLFGSEWEWVQKLGKAIIDPEEKKAFWDTVREKKLTNPGYSIYQDFPRSENATARAREECVEFVRSLRRAKVEGESA
jgi:hypothetical protein